MTLLKKAKKILIFSYVVISIASFIFSAYSLHCFELFEHFIDNRNAAEKTCELPITLEAEPNCKWKESQMVTVDLRSSYEEAPFNSDLYWLCIEDQEEYTQYKAWLDLPKYDLPSEEKYYIISLGRKIDSFYIANVFYKTDGRGIVSFSDYYSLLCRNLEKPKYRGIAKYDKDHIDENKIYIYSIDKVSILSPTIYDLPQMFR